MEAHSILVPYFAGLFDGEGSVFILRQNNRRSTYHSSKAEVSNTVRRPLDLLKSKYGGTVYIHIRQGENRKDIYIWHITNRQAYNFLKEIEPYLLIKREHVQVAIELQERIANYNLEKKKLGLRYANLISDEEEDLREQLRLRLKALNKRGIDK